MVGRDAEGPPRHQECPRQNQGRVCGQAGKAAGEYGRAPAPEPPKPGISLGDWLDHWYQTYKKANLRPNTQMSYERRIYQHIIPASRCKSNWTS